MDACLSDPKKIIMKLRVNWGHASAQQWKRALAGSDGVNMHLADYAGVVSGRREGRRAFLQGPACAYSGDLHCGNV